MDNRKLLIEYDISDTAVIKDYIEADLKNPKKLEMLDGEKYFKVEHDILGIDFREYIIDGQSLIDYNKANNQNTNPFHRLLVQQKIGYIAGKPITITTDEDNYSKKINEVLGMKFDEIISEWIKGSSNKGVEWLHPFINEDGELDYIIIPAEQAIPIYDTSYQKKLIYFIRYYVMYVLKGDKVFERYRVELWDKEKVTFFIQDDEGNYYLDDTEENNPRYHWYSFNTNSPHDIKENSWGKVPFINLNNNSEQISDLKPIKKYIDAYDKVSSGFLNDLEDIQTAIWILKGYSGEDLSEFMRDLMTFKAIKVDDDDSNVDSKTLEIPYEAKKVILEILEDKIYEIGQGVKMSTDKFGQNPSGVALKFMYSGLDLKAGTMINKLKKSLQEFMWFITKYINLKEKTNYEYKNVKFTINKTIITNETEQIDNCTKSMGVLSDETILANHPWVDNVLDEQERLKQQQIKNDKNPYLETGEEDE